MNALAQLHSDLSRGVRIVHEWHFGGERWRAVTYPDCSDTVFIERWRSGLMRWDREPHCLVDEEAALVMELAALAGRGE